MLATRQQLRLDLSLTTAMATAIVLQLVVDVPRHLAKTEHFSAWQIRNMGFAYEWHHVMFTQREDVDILHYHHLIVILIEYSITDHF